MAAGGGAEELNLIPYMDIIVTLVLCMVFTVSLLEDFRTAEVDVPSGVGVTGEPLFVVVAPEGFEVRHGHDVVSLPRDAQGWPYAQLAGVLRGVRDAEPGAPKLTLTPEAAVPYKVVVATLDAMRTDARGPLFPDVALAIARR